MVASAAAFYGKGPRRPGVVDADDVEAIRRLVLTRPAGPDGVQVGEGEALWLAQLDRATGLDNAPAWRDLFVKALAMYLPARPRRRGACRLCRGRRIREYLDGGQGAYAERPGPGR